MIITELALQALRIPAGWSVEINHFYDLEPTAGEIEIRDKRFNETDGWTFFDEDLLFLMNSRYDKRIRLKLYLTWAPSRSPDGRFILELAKGSLKTPEEILLVFESRDKAEIVHKINSVLEEVSVHEPRLSGKVLFP